MDLQTPPPEWLTRDEAAAVLRVSPQTIDKLRRDGNLPYSKVGRLIRIDRLDVDALLRPAA